MKKLIGIPLPAFAADDCSAQATEKTRGCGKKQLREEV